MGFNCRRCDNLWPHTGLRGLGSDRLTNPNYEFRKRFSRFYYRYKPECSYWGVAILFRKLAIVAILHSFSTHPTFQAAASIAVLVTCYALHMELRPYLSSKVVRASPYSRLTNCRTSSAPPRIHHMKDGCTFGNVHV